MLLIALTGLAYYCCVVCVLGRSAFCQRHSVLHARLFIVRMRMTLCVCLPFVNIAQSSSAVGRNLAALDLFAVRSATMVQGLMS